MFNKVISEAHAFEIVGFTPDIEKLKASGFYPEDRVQSKYDEFVIELICEANNKINNWKADMADDDQIKYSTAHWVELDESKPAGFGLVFTGCGHWDSFTAVGERLLVGSSQQAIYIGEQFKPLFESARLIPRKK